MMKQTGKLTILMVAVVAIGIFALPSIMSAGAGQHTFVNATSLRSNDAAKSCLKCHATQSDDVGGELKRSDNNVFYNYSGGNKTIHSSVGCGGCHDLTRARSSDQTLYANSHTKVPRQPTCVRCHDGVYNNAITQGPLNNVWNELNNTYEAHNGFTDPGVAAVSQNIGCLGCHTRIQVTGEVSYTYSAGWQNVLGLNIGNATAGKPIITP